MQSTHMAVTLPIYMDHMATTPVAPEVFEAMRPYFCERFGNPASRSHSFGWVAEEAVELARAQVARLLGCKAAEIVWTSGATEANNLAIKGVAAAYREKGRHIVTSQIEHHAVLDTCKRLEREGYEVTYLPVDQDGRLDPADVERAIRKDTILISIMAANNEIGTLQPIAEIGLIAKRHGVLFHTDAAQYVGKLPLSVDDWQVDLLSASAHKCYGPKGVGALYVRMSRPRVKLVPQMDGGGHEKGRRSGTLNVPGCVGFGAACALAERELETQPVRLRLLRERLRNELESGLDYLRFNGHPTERLPGNLNVSFECVEGESLLMALREIAVSSGSACTSATTEPSYVLLAIGLNVELAHASIRFGLGRSNTEEEVDYVGARVIENIDRLRALSPSYEMVREGIGVKGTPWNLRAY